MGRYVVQRIAQLVFVFIGVTFVIYTSVWVLPGDPIQGMAGGQPISASTIEALRDRFNLDDPLPEQYLKYALNLLQGDLGTDFQGRPIADQMAQRWPVTIRLALTAWVMLAVAGIGAGTLAAAKKGGYTDSTILLLGVGIISIPGFVLAYTAQLVFGVHWGLLPAAGVSAGWPRSYLMPAFLLAASGWATIARIVRSSVADNLRADYARLAYAKGLSRTRVLLRHILRNSLIPAITVLGIELGYLLGGTVIVEGIFNLPGIGQLLFQSIALQEGTVVVGVSSVLVLVFLIANLVVDLMYGFLDPRIRHAR